MTVTGGFNLRSINGIPSRSLFPGITEMVIHEEPGILIKVFTMDSAFETEAHSHPEKQVMVIDEGTLDMEIGGKHVRVTAGDTVTIEGGVPHRAWSGGGKIAGVDVIFRIASG